MAGPPDIRYSWTTDSGQQVTIRPIRPEDRDIERAFVLGLSSNSKYLRFFSAIKDLSPRMLDRFTQVNYPQEMAFIATIPDGDSVREIGVARYVPGESSGTAEFAVVVADSWQGRGVGRELLRQLFAVAKDVGFLRMEGIVLKANGNMLKFCRELGFIVGAYAGDAKLVRVVRDL